MSAEGELKDLLIELALNALQTISQQRTCLWHVAQEVPDCYSKYDKTLNDPLIKQHIQDGMHPLQEAADQLRSGAPYQQVLQAMREAVVKIQKMKN